MRKLLLALLVVTGSLFLVTDSHADLDPQEAEFLALLNDYRAANGAPPVYLEPTIEDATEWHATDMAEKGYFNHTDSLGRSPFQRMCDFGYCYNTYKGEIIAAGYSSAAQVLAAWKASPGHDAIMRGPNYHAIGFSRVEVPGSVFRYYWSADFGGVLPSPACPADLNGDRFINSLDLTGYESAMYTQVGDPGYWRYLDQNNSGGINTLDLVAYNNTLNTPCG